MKFDHIYQGVGAWMDETGPESDIVISSRVRLARNVAGYHFFAHSTTAERSDLLHFIHKKLMSTHLKDQLQYLKMTEATALERQLLIERHLISKELAESEGPRAVALTSDETLAVMINEEDHLRIQMMASGLQLKQTYQRISEVDDLLEEKMEFAFSSQYGYLTACPTNVGTGIRVSVMLHLPGLKMSGEIEKVFRAAKDMRLAVRGLYGEGSEPIGDFFQLSNQTTLGKTEDQIIEQLVSHAVKPIVEYERLARRKLLEERLALLDDKIFRAQGILNHARMISSEETLYMLSYIRLGIHLGRIKNISLETLNRLFLQTKPGHLQNYYQEPLNEQARDRARADLIRKQLTN
ncbi:MAG: protein arginine kinase [Planctomycetes bacterium]|nr:protein arginine kinase [Planctomycetota bacterium]